jgi:hypothetical protein
MIFIIFMHLFYCSFSIYIFSSFLHKFLSSFFRYIFSVTLKAVEVLAFTNKPNVIIGYVSGAGISLNFFDIVWYLILPIFGLQKFFSQLFPPPFLYQGCFLLLIFFIVFLKKNNEQKERKNIYYTDFWSFHIKNVPKESLFCFIFALSVAGL